MKKKQKLIVANWKMNPLSLAEAAKIFTAIKKTSKKLVRTKTVVCPPYIYVSDLLKLSKREIPIGVQNVSNKRSGSFTGDVSAAQAAEIGAAYAIIGHSERRAMGETDKIVAEKISQALGEGLRAIVCVGEKERDTEARYLEFLKEQVKNSLASVSKKDLKNIIIAYEPIWAIGKSDEDAPAGKDVYETTLYIRKVLTGIFDKDAAFAVPMLYGGSVTFRNTEDIVKEGTVDGLLIGRQSLEPKGFAEVLSIVDTL